MVNARTATVKARIILAGLDSTNNKIAIISEVTDNTNTILEAVNTGAIIKKIDRAQ